jgi:hypothetical protein
VANEQKYLANPRNRLHRRLMWKYAATAAHPNAEYAQLECNQTRLGLAAQMTTQFHQIIL